MRRLASILLVVVAAAFHAIASVGTASAEVVIGVFSDGGTNCSFSGNNAGPLTMHVVVRSDGQGIRGVRFAAPIPSCFDATFLNDIVPDDIFSIGDSQTGITLVWASCVTNPIHVLDINYFSNGATPCCEFGLAPDPTVGELEATDCSFATGPMTSLASHLNADSTCECHFAFPPPIVPANPSPADGAMNVLVTTALGWTTLDGNDLPVTCDVYLGPEPNPPLVAADVPVYMVWSYRPARLIPATTYHWRIVARNSLGSEITGPIWTFTTRENPLPVVQNISPVNGVFVTIQNPTLHWSGTDDSPLTYDLYFGANPTPPKKATTTAQQYSPGPLTFGVTYYWYVVARDLDGGESSSPTWSFTVSNVNQPPAAPSNPSPPDGATNSPLSVTLHWTSSDPEGQPLSYDVYFGTTEPLPWVRSLLINTSFSIQGLAPSALYKWRIVAIDQIGQQTIGPTWSFSTRANVPPNAPSSPSPADGATARPVNTTLSWQASDPDGQALTYDVYFGTDPSPPLVASNVTTKSYSPGAQAYLTTYRWRIVVRDPLGAESSGPTWSYTTKSSNEPPSVPVVVSPATGATGVPVNVTLSWSATDPENQPLNYDVYFAISDIQPTLIGYHVTTTTYFPGQLAMSRVYRWRIVARDPEGLETPGPVWTFTTASTDNLPPVTPSDPNPVSGGVSSQNPLLQWISSDPDGDPISYTVWFGPVGGLTQVAVTNVRQHQVGPLIPGLVYQWFVMAADAHWSVTGPIWSFTVGGGELPVLFSRFDATQAGDGVEVRWTLSSDETMDGYTLYRRQGASQHASVIASGPVSRLEDSYLDTAVVPGATYRYELVIRAHDGDEFRSPVATVTLAALELALYQNHPNPFNPQTSIRYDLPGAAGATRVALLILDIAGRRIRTLVDEAQPAGPHEVVWNGRDDAGNAVSSGVYFYVLDTGKQRLTRKLVLLK